MKGAPKSDIFDDVYFSAADGLAETQHVFLKSNHLPELWHGKKQFVIAETGFGMGLNFFATCALFDETRGHGQHLHFISVEKYPQRFDKIENALAPWSKELGMYVSLLKPFYPILVNGFHRINLRDDLALTLIFDDINEALPRLESPVDCWFLDGFKPASNPDMWSETVFKNMARLSVEGGRFATFTAAGFVKRGLQDAGFIVEKIKGYGTKREMLSGYKSKNA